MIIYADLTFFNNFVMTLAIIWTTAKLLDYDYKWFRLILAALIGTIYTFLALFLQLYYVQSFIQNILQFLLNIITALIIIKIAFGYMNRKKYWKAIIYLYLTSFITIGTILSVTYIAGGNILTNNKIIRFILVGVLFLLLIGKYGWRIFQNYISPDVFYLPIKICIYNKVIKLTGLVDTGNSLRDPLTGVPVIVVSIENISSILPEEIKTFFKELSRDEVKLASAFNQAGWGSRIRFLPFTALGKNQGIMVGLRPDKVEIEYQGKRLETGKVVIALSRNKLDPGDEYQALIHPQMIQY